MKSNILLVEDDKSCQQAIINLFQTRDLPYNLTIVDNCTTTKEKLLNKKFHLILCNWNLKNGVNEDIIAKIAHVPIIILTDDKNEDEALATNLLHVRDYLKKDEDYSFIKYLPIKIENILNRKDNVKRLEATLRAVDCSAVVSITDNKGIITKVNQTFCTISQYSEIELLGKSHNIVNSNYHGNSFWQQMWQTINSGKTWRADVKNQAKDGSFYWVDTVINPIYNSLGTIDSYFSIRSLITIKKEQAIQLLLKEQQLEEAIQAAGQHRIELEKSQLALHDANKKFKFAIKAAKAGTWFYTFATDNNQWDDNALKVYGIGPKDFGSSYAAWRALIHPDDVEKVELDFNDAIKNKSVFSNVHRAIRPDGDYVYVLSQASLRFDEKGNPTEALGLVFDITEKVVREQELIQAKEIADRANKAKSDFLSNMSHELRTPMNAIMGFAQLLQLNFENGLSHKELEQVSEILKASDHLLNLINEILDLSKIENNSVEFSIEEVDINLVLQEQEQILNSIAQKKEIDIQYSCQCPIDMTMKVLIRVDRVRFKQVILNLVSNAIKYNNAGGYVRLSCYKLDERIVRVLCRDNGLGIAKEKQSQLFQPFQRLSEHQREIEGTGIGLSITKNLVELMGGTIGYTSEPDKGSSFWVDFHYEEKRVIQVNDKSKEDTKVDKEGSSLQKARILYIEDNPANLQLIKMVLSHEPNITLLTAHSGSLGLEIAMADDIDLFLVDINLPGMNGYEILKKLRQTPQYTKVPFFAVSANAMEGDIEKGKKAGFDEYLAKPLDLAQFNEKLTIHLN